MEQLKLLPKQLFAALSYIFLQFLLSVISGIAAFFAAPFLLAFFKRTGESTTYYLLACSTVSLIGGIASLAASSFSLPGMPSLSQADRNAAFAISAISLLLALGKLASVWSRERNGDYIFSGSIGEPRFPIFWKIAGPRPDVFRVGFFGSFLLLAGGIAISPIWPVCAGSLVVIWFFSGVYFAAQFLKFRFDILTYRDASLYGALLEAEAAGHSSEIRADGLNDETAVLLGLYSSRPSK